MFARNSKARLLQLRTQLQSMRKGNFSISDYIMKIRVIMENNLAAIGLIVSDDDLLMCLLGGLDSEYNVAVAMLTARP